VGDKDADPGAAGAPAPDGSSNTPEEDVPSPPDPEDILGTIRAIDVELSNQHADLRTTDPADTKTIDAIKEQIRTAEGERRDLVEQYRQATGNEPPQPKAPPKAPPPAAGPAAAKPVAPAGPANAGPTVKVVTDGGQVMPGIAADRPFFVVVEVPRGTTPPPDTTEITIHAADGDHTLTIAWDKGVSGPVTYRSKPITLTQGAEGGGRFGIEKPIHSIGDNSAWLEFSLGGMGSVKVSDGDVLSITAATSAGAAGVSIPAYESAVHQQIAINHLYLGAVHNWVVNSLINLKTAGNSPAVVQARQLLSGKLILLEHAQMDLNLPNKAGDVEQLNFSTAYVNLVRLNVPYSRNDEKEMMEKAADKVHDKYVGSWVTFSGDFATGMYQLTLSQLPFVSSTWTLWTGTDPFGRKVDGWDKVMAACDLASQGAMLGLPIAVQQQFAVARTTPRMVIDEPLSTRPLTAGDITQAPAGTPIEHVEDFGIDQAQGVHFRQTLEVHGQRLGQKIFAGVRPTGKTALGMASEGFPGKAEPLKGKTAAKVDIRGGWATEEGPVFYPSPEQVADAIGMAPDDIVMRTDGGWQEGTRPPQVDPEVWDQAVSRVKAFYDEAPMMNELIERGLCYVDAEGYVVDTGVSNYGLDPETHELVQKFDGPAGGTGKRIYGDPDLFGFWFADGTMLTEAQIAPIVVDLAPRFTVNPDGSLRIEGARVMHPDIASWDPHEPKNIGIQQKIFAKHMGAAMLDADGRAVGIGPLSPNGEGLIFIGGYADPPVVGYSTGLPEMPTKTFESLPPPAAAGPTPPPVVLPPLHLPSPGTLGFPPMPDAGMPSPSGAQPGQPPAPMAPIDQGSVRDANDAGAIADPEERARADEFLHQVALDTTRQGGSKGRSPTPLLLGVGAVVIVGVIGFTLLNGSQPASSTGGNGGADQSQVAQASDGGGAQASDGGAQASDGGGDQSPEAPVVDIGSSVQDCLALKFWQATESTTATFTPPGQTKPVSFTQDNVVTYVNNGRPAERIDQTVSNVTHTEYVINTTLWQRTGNTFQKTQLQQAQADGIRAQFDPCGFLGRLNAAYPVPQLPQVGVEAKDGIQAMHFHADDQTAPPTGIAPLAAGTTIDVWITLDTNVPIEIDGVNVPLGIQKTTFKVTIRHIGDSTLSVRPS